MPVIETGVGNCHVYVDAAADLDKAVAIVAQLQDAAAQRLQRRRDAAGPRATSRTRSCPRALAALRRAGRRPCTATSRWRRTPPQPGSTVAAGAPTRTGQTEYLSLDLAAAVVDSPRRGASRTSGTWSSAGTPRRSSPTTSRPPDGSSPVSTRRRCMVNASTRFTDGGRVRVRRRDRHLHPEAARPRPDGRCRS